MLPAFVCARFDKRLVAKAITVAAAAHNPFPRSRRGGETAMLATDA